MTQVSADDVSVAWDAWLEGRPEWRGVLERYAAAENVIRAIENWFKQSLAAGYVVHDIVWFIDNGRLVSVDCAYEKR